MSRYIDKDELVRDVLTSWDKDNHVSVAASYVHRQEHNHLMRIIEKQPTADVVEVRHAAWVWGEICSSKGYCCTNCGAGFTGENAEWIAKEHKYCPNCGAKMDGERREG